MDTIDKGYFQLAKQAANVVLSLLPVMSQSDYFLQLSEKYSIDHDEQFRHIQSICKDVIRLIDDNEIIPDALDGQLTNAVIMTMAWTQLQALQ